MGLDEVKKEILNNAKKQANKIIAEAEKEKDKLLSQLDEKIKEIKSKIDEETKISVDQYKSMVFTETSAFIKKQKLSLEKEMIEKVFEKAKEKLKDLPQNKRKVHILKLMEKISSDFNKVYCNEKDRFFLSKYYPTDEKIIGGLIFESKTGEIRIDLSYEALLEEIKKENISDVSKMLFKM